MTPAGLTNVRAGGGVGTALGVTWLYAASVGRFRRWLVVGAVIWLLGGAAPLGARFHDAQKNDPSLRG
jgi:hypothetical protein